MKTRYIVLLTLLFLSYSSWGQDTVSVSGKISDQDGFEIIGASVMLEGTSLGTTSDVTGRYSVSLPADKAVDGTLAVSYIGFKTVSVKIAGRTTIDIVLEEDMNVLDETVVVGYGSMRKSDLTGSVASVKVDEQLASQSSSLDQLLMGRASGVQILSNNASPDAGVQIRIRGANSFNGKNEPLYVVDGIIVNAESTSLTTFTQGASNSSSDEEVNGLMGINPQDIANIEILKDASATAIYGSQGANGVVLITTKVAKNSKPTVRFSAGVDVGVRNRKMDMLSFDEYVAYVDDLHAAAPDVLDDSAYNSLMKKLYKDPDTRMELKVRPVDWQDHVMRTAVSQRYHLSISGKPKGIAYNLSFGYNDTQGIVKTTDNEQYTVRFNIEKAFGDKVTVGAKTNFAYIRSNLTQGTSGRITSGASFMRSMLMSRPYSYLLEEDEDDDDFVAGPDKWLKDFVSRRDHFKSGGNIYVEYRILPWLTFKSVFGANVSSLKMSKFKSMRISREVGSIAGVARRDNLMWTFDNMLMANKSFGHHHLSGTIGASLSENTMSSESIEGWDIEQYFAKVSSINSARSSNMSWWKEANSLASAFVRAIYNYRDRYVLTATYRLDGSSRFQGSNKWSSFPSFAFAWRVNQERWFNVEAVSQLKIRAGWGLVGNQALSNYQTFSNYSDGKLASHAGSAGYDLSIYASNIANPDLRWETTEQYNVGLDLGLFNGRISLTADLYDKTTKDLLQQKTISLSSGYETIWMNQGAIRNRGLELTVETVPVASNDFEWTIGGNISFNRNRILSIGESGSRGVIYLSEGNPVETTYFLGREMTGSVAGSTINIFMEGYPMGLFYAYKTEGIVQEGDTGPGFSLDQPLGPGHYKYVDVDGNGYIDSNDRTIIGDPNPDFTFGFNTSFSYKRLSLSVAFNGSYGNDVFNLNNDSEYDVGRYTYNLRKAAYVNAWTPQNPSDVFPALGSVTGGDRTHYRSNCVEDASYLRLSNVSISYNVPIKKNKVIRGISLGVSGRNLAVFTKYSGWDPDVNSFGSDMMRMGVDFNSYPQARTFGFDMKLTF
ncbi:MAG: TonB-dependent receptor [Bacteroidales bacterium]|nr:TonB-dependent receptor [Bacteroidales bacterium]